MNVKLGNLLGSCRLKDNINTDFSDSKLCQNCVMCWASLKAALKLGLPENEECLGCLEARQSFKKNLYYS